MQIFLQIAIGVIPLVLFSIVSLIRKKLKIMPVMFTLLSIGVVVMGIFAWNSDEQKNELEKKVVSSEDYMYLAEKYMSEGDFTAARNYLDKMYKEVGETPKGTLCNARLEVLSGDYDGARVLYEKIEKTDEGKKLLTQADTEFAKDYDEGKAIPKLEASSSLDIVNLYKQNGGKIEDLGLTTQDVENITAAAKGETKYEQKLTDAIKDELDETEKTNEDRYEMLSEAINYAEAVNAQYEDYKNGKLNDISELTKARKELQKIFEKDASVFEVTDIDEAFVKALMADAKYKELIEYAQATDSPSALIALAQEVIRGNLDDKDFPDSFISVSEEEQQEIIEACEKALEKLSDKDKLDESEQEELEDIIDNLKNLNDDPVLSEIDSRLHPDKEALENQSKIYFGNSTIDYALGKDEKGDKNLSHAVETYTYSNDGNYVESVTNISKVINGTAEEDEVKNVNQYFKDAYDSAVITNNDSKNQTVLDENGKPDTKRDPYNGIGVNGSNFVTKKLAMINISGIDISEFPKVKLTIQSGEKLNLKDIKLSLSDCDINISDFKIEKVDYSNAKIYVVCDSSGSMSGSIETLQSAVRSFVATIGKNEQVSVVTFSSSVIAASPLTNDPKELDSYIDAFRSGGGTNVASGAFHALNELSGSSDSFNVIMLMTDGEDTSFREAKLKELQEKCTGTNTVLYTIGLGSAVQPEYLKTIASYGGGSFVYCTDAVALESLYRFIHKQMENNYVITYNAVDTKTNMRNVKIINNEDLSSATKYYTLGMDEANVDENGDFIPTDGNIHINGLETKKIYKKDTDVSVGIEGANFKKEHKCSVSIKGDAYKGTFEGRFVSEYKFDFTVPKEVPAGNYDVTIIVDGQAVTDSLEILIPGKITEIKYGAYVFRGQSISKDEDTITITGDVSMNDFIHFKGTVKLVGKIGDNAFGESEEDDSLIKESSSDTNIKLIDNAGSYIEYSKNLPGLLGKLCGNRVVLPSLGTRIIYDDKAHYSDLDNYTVEEFTFGNIMFGGIIYQGPSVALYPHKINMHVIRLETGFPLQDELFKYAGGTENPFGNITCDVTGFINNSGLYIVGKAGYENSNSRFDFGTFNFGVNELSFEFDTFNHNYNFKFILGTNTSSIIPGFVPAEDGKKDAGYGFSFGIKEGKFDSFMIYADFKIIVPDTPVTISALRVGAEDMSKVDQNGNFAKKVFETTFVGGCDISVAKLADYVPAAEPFVGDLAFVTFADTMSKFNLLKFKREFESTIKLLGEFECGKVEIKTGKYDYEDYILDIDSKEVIGLYLSIANGPNIDYPNLKVKVQGTQTISINNKALALKMGGVIDCAVNFFGKHESNLDGCFELALVDLDKFYIVLRGTDLQKNKDAGFKICLDGWDSYIKLY